MKQALRRSRRWYEHRISSMMWLGEEYVWGFRLAVNYSFNDGSRARMIFLHLDANASVIGRVRS